jgi:hypothetical protein
MDKTKGRRLSAPGLALVAFIALVLAGCGGVKSYRSDLPHNVHFRTVVTTGSIFKSAAADVDIYRDIGNCKIQHLGRVTLDKPVVEVGVPAGEPIYIEFLLMSKTFLSSSASALRYDTQLMLRPGYEYDMQLKFLERTYTLEMRELKKGSSSGRLIERKSGSDCKPKKS